MPVCDFFLRGFGLESEWADTPGIGMAPSRIIETVDVLKDGGSSLTSCWPTLSPKHFGLEAPEKGLDHGVVVAVSLAGHGRCYLVFRPWLSVCVQSLHAKTG